jgi:hypothetical protein
MTPQSPHAHAHAHAIFISTTTKPLPDSFDLARQDFEAGPQLLLLLVVKKNNYYEGRYKPSRN